MKFLITKWDSRLFLIPGISIKWDEWDPESESELKILSIDFLRWSLEISITKQSKPTCIHNWREPFDSGWRQCRLCKKIEEPH